MAATKSSGANGSWNGHVTVGAQYDLRKVERSLREAFPAKAIEVHTNPNHKGW